MAVLPKLAHPACDRPGSHPQALGNLHGVAAFLAERQHLLVRGLPGVLPTDDVWWRGWFPCGRRRSGDRFARGTRQGAAQFSHRARDNDIDLLHQVLHEVKPI